MIRPSQRHFAPENLDPRLRAGLVGHWIGGGSGNTWLDRSGYGNHGALSGPTWSLGEGGKRQAVAFDGVNDIVTMPAATPSMAAITIALWVNPRTVVGQYGVVNNWNGPPYAYLTRLATGGTGYQFYTWTSAGLSGGDFAGTIAANKWTHLVATYDGATMRVYFDGRASATTVAQTGDINAGLGIQLGMQNFGYLSGALDDVRIYNRALSSAEIALLGQSSFLPVVPRRWFIGPPVTSITTDATAAYSTWAAPAATAQLKLRRAISVSCSVASYNIPVSAPAQAAIPCSSSSYQIEVS